MISSLEPYVYPVLAGLGWAPHREARTERSTWVAVSLPIALAAGVATVAVGAFEALDQVVGIESWSWLVVSGAAALTVAATLELTDSEVDGELVG